MSIFSKAISFSKQDPLDNGLADEIAAERSESDAFGDEITGDELTSHWDAIIKDVRKDSKVKFSNK